jgi:hypothetical protein
VKALAATLERAGSVLAGGPSPHGWTHLDGAAWAPVTTGGAIEGQVPGRTGNGET